MTFEEVLGALLAVVGKEVAIAIESPSGGMAAQFGGRLTRGVGLGPAPKGTEAITQPSRTIFFAVEAGVVDGGFLIDPAAFVSASWISGTRVLLIRDVSGVEITV